MRWSRTPCSLGCAVVLVLAATPGTVQAQVQAPAAPDPYVGVVSDSTVTFIGQEFYRAFMAVWREQPYAERYSLAIIERPSARLGSMVWIEYANRRIYSTILSPGRRDAVRQSGAEAARIAYRNAVDADAERLLFRDPDLARDEF